MLVKMRGEIQHRRYDRACAKKGVPCACFSQEELDKLVPEEEVRKEVQPAFGMWLLDVPVEG